MIAETSRQAHDFIKPHKKPLREVIYDYILSQAFNGATIAEISAATGIKESTVCGRVSELHDPEVGKPRICNSGRKRKTDSGCPAIVWWTWTEPVQQTLF